ncbi:ectoine/hydroxyectoine ABC transporter permease subunit EhuD [Luteipulveratus halotolerans]|uniref:Amino acid ABC transporter permease n=1 Tax=Luteipulveratus halotolerans TaxID=1631356 RepID=A0A0L6CPN3_9MICO|nr:ectoine/hydroxyectoine ABC transporter permease subunit EhuD [Luteipulveratus halotolerans]KNX39473.1 amino acid ABC transporter permease [Luteipulveratus halotolerans]
MIPSEFQWDNDFAADALPMLLQGLRLTVEISLLGFVLAAVLGLVVAVVRRSKVPVLSHLFSFYVLFIRGTPLLVQAIFVYFVLPKLPGSISLSLFQAGVVVLGVNYSAYCAEVYRAGIEDVPVGQWEAATALSLPSATTWGRIVLPQAIRRVIPILGNYLVQMFKDSAVLLGIGVVELLNSANIFGQDSYRFVEPMVLAGLLYLVISIPASIFFRVMERRFAVNA